MLHRLQREGSRTLQGIGTMPPIFYEHLIPNQVKEWFTDQFDVTDSNDNDKLLERLSLAFTEHGTSPDLKLVPETVQNARETSVQETHLDLLQKS